MNVWVYIKDAKLFAHVLKFIRLFKNLLDNLTKGDNFFIKVSSGRQLETYWGTFK